MPFGVHSNDEGTHPRPNGKWNMCLLMEGCVWLEHALCAHQGWYWMDMHAHVYGWWGDAGALWGRACVHGGVRYVCGVCWKSRKSWGRKGVESSTTSRFLLHQHGPSHL